MPHQPTILVADDSADDLFLIESSLRSAKIIYPVQTVRNGDQVVDYLKGEPPFDDREKYPFPELLLLDLKMPGKDGFEVLQWIRQSPQFHSLRVIVLTSSSQIGDVNNAYALGANSFLVKPMDLENFVELGKYISDYWMRIDRSPLINQPSVSDQPNIVRTVKFGTI